MLSILKRKSISVEYYCYDNRPGDSTFDGIKNFLYPGNTTIHSFEHQQKVLKSLIMTRKNTYKRKVAIQNTSPTSSIARKAVLESQLPILCFEAALAVSIESIRKEFADKLIWDETLGAKITLDDLRLIAAETRACLTVTSRFVSKTLGITDEEELKKLVSYNRREINTLHGFSNENEDVLNFVRPI